MKKILFSLLFGSGLLAFPARTMAQYCYPAVTPYASTMPGIVNFKIGTINRTSAGLESGVTGPVITNDTTTLIAGHSYAVSITHIIDASICPDMNLRLWIDLNNDTQLDDPGETLISKNHHLPGSSFDTTIVIPSTATLGYTKLRVTAKMSDLGGHTLPTPCNDPPDAIGYHGEMEDYVVKIVDATGVEAIPEFISSVSVNPNPCSDYIHLSVVGNDSRSFETSLTDILGNQVKIGQRNVMAKGQNSFMYSVRDLNLASGIYFLKLSFDGYSVTRKVVISGE